MSTRRKGSQGDSTTAFTGENINHGHGVNSNNERIEREGNGPGSGSLSGYEYEQFRDQRIKENKERMRRLGLLDLSRKLKSRPRQPKETLKNVSSEKKPHNPLPPSGSPRRSSRLKSMTPVNYTEMPPKLKRESAIGVEICLREGSQPEIYTEEHEKLLGDCKTTWTLYVDGCDKNGKRIYDPEMGETCHQCRQKTLGLHTHCSKCTLVQGQFCGDCLFMRYGENVIEVNQNPDWICPVCRGICNCSLCRQAKGWAPTGALYRKVIRLGFKSVAHYLIQTRRPQMHTESLGAENLAPGKGEQCTADKGSQPLSCNESLIADELCQANLTQVPILDEFPNPHPVGYETEVEGEEKQMNCSCSSKHVDINDGYQDANGDNTVNDDNKLKGKNTNIGLQGDQQS